MRGKDKDKLERERIRRVVVIQCLFREFGFILNSYKPAEGFYVNIYVSQILVNMHKLKLCKGSEPALKLKTKNET